MFQYVIISNKSYIKYDNEYTQTNLTKLFHGDILDKEKKLVYSDARQKFHVGYFSTSQITKFGKNKSGKTIYLVNTFDNNLPPFLVSYGGKKKGKMIIRFKFVKWDKKLPTGNLVSVIGKMEDKNLINTLLYYYNIYPKKILLEPKINSHEQNIKRIDLTNLDTISIDPKGCSDIDDCLSFKQIDDNIYIGIHIAQPIYWLTELNIKNICEKRFSTLYINDEIQKNLWNDKITKLASLSQNEKKPTYSIIYTIKDNKIINIVDYPSWIINNNVLSYNNCKTNKIVQKLQNITQNIDKNIINSHELVKFWMIKTNNYIGKKINKIKLPCRVNKRSSFFQQTNYNKIPDNIKQAIYFRTLESAYYSLTEKHHASLSLDYYTHFTSPIRRVVDTIIHYYLTYNILIDIDWDKINKLDSQTKKFHRTINFYKTINSFFKNSEQKNIYGYIYKILYPNRLELYTEELGFIKVNIFNNKFSYQYKCSQDNDYYIIESNTEKFKYKLGDKINISVVKKKGFLPKNKINISLI